jgi:catechol 2,3-dioxygenase-like lactoylglutathione lyase family enzyme
MPNQHFILFYVDDPQTSARFYRRLLAREPVETSPTFAMFALDSGLMLGLWSSHTVEPKPSGGAGSAELAFTVETAEAVDRQCADWRAQGLSIIQQPTDMDFGRTFVATDPDEHRLRVFFPLPPS